MPVGNADGVVEGVLDGSEVVGSEVGVDVGILVGTEVGVDELGASVGTFVGIDVGDVVHRAIPSPTKPDLHVQAYPRGSWGSLTHTALSWHTWKLAH